MFRQQQFIELLSHRNILIAGYGREGQSTHRLLQDLFPNQSFDIARNNEEIFAALQRHHYDLVFKSPGIPTFVFEGRCNLDAITSQTDVFLQVYADLTVAVSGTKGKSTTTTLIHHVLAAHPRFSHAILAGNMGIPLFDILPQLNDDTVVVAELSCHQLENIHRGPHIALLLNLFQEHLDHYHDYMDYKMAKMQMALRQHPDDHFFYCSDNDDLRLLVASHQFPSHLHPYCLDDANRWWPDGLTTSLQGDHNRSNIFAAFAALQLLGVDLDCFAPALASFHGLPHRLEYVGSFGGVIFYNDSISTIPQAAIAAVEALHNVDTLILGGFDRGIDYAPLAAFLAHASVRNYVFVGQAGRRMASLFNPLPSNVLFADDYRAIVPWCFQHTRPGAICLLSPAAASYDAFKNFEERGAFFKQLILDYKP